MRTEITITARRAAIVVRILQEPRVKGDGLTRGKERDIESVIEAFGDADRIVIRNREARRG
jgi:hypothetical protein